jgi:hypothetical protein
MYPPVNKLKSILSLNEYNNDENILIYKEYMLDIQNTWFMKGLERLHRKANIIDPIKLYQKFQSPEILDMEVLDMSYIYNQDTYEDTLEELHKTGFTNITKYCLGCYNVIQDINANKDYYARKGLFHHNAIITDFRFNTNGEEETTDDVNDYYNSRCIINTILNNYNEGESIFNEGLKRFSIVYDNIRFGETADSYHENIYNIESNVYDICNVLSYLPNTVEEIFIENAKFHDKSFSNLFTKFPNNKLKFINHVPIQYYIDNFSDITNDEPLRKMAKFN